MCIYIYVYIYIDITPYLHTCILVFKAPTLGEAVPCTGHDPSGRTPRDKHGAFRIALTSILQGSGLGFRGSGFRGSGFRNSVSYPIPTSKALVFGSNGQRIAPSLATRS